MPVTPLGFRFQRVSPPGSCRPLDLRVLHAVSPSALPQTSLAEATFRLALAPRAAASRIEAPGRSVPARRGFTHVREADPLLAVPLFEVPTHQPRLRASTVPPLMGLGSIPTGEPVTIFACSSKSQRTDGLDPTLSTRVDLHEVFVLACSTPKRRVRSGRPRLRSMRIGRAHV